MEELNQRILDLALGRTLKRIYLPLKENDKLIMEEIFLSDDEAAKQKFIKKQAPDFKKIFREELKRLEEEISFKIESQ